MKGPPFYWNGFSSSIYRERNWKTLWLPEVRCSIGDYINRLRLPAAGAIHATNAFRCVEKTRQFFSNPDDFWRFSCNLCDQYCDAFILARRSDSNVFYENSQIYDAIANAAIKAKGYVGPREWWDLSSLLIR